MFQDDIYPPCPSGEPALSADEWLAGVNKNPKLVEITSKGLGKETTSAVSLLSVSVHTHSHPPPPYPPYPPPLHRLLQSQLVSYPSKSLRGLPHLVVHRVLAVSVLSQCLQK